ncbi:hypothetical protein Tco_0854122 [Tanacetum coccineum]
MSSNDALSTVTYTSVSSGSSEPSAWGIPLVNVGEFPNVDPYEEVAQHGQAHPLSPAYVPDIMELDEHVPLYVPEHHDSSEEDMSVEDQPNAEDADSCGFLADSDSMEDDTDADSIDYPDKPEDGEDDDEDPEEDPSEEHESEDEEAKEDDPFKDSDKTEPFEEDKTAATPPSPGRRGAKITVRPQPPIATSTQALIDAFAAGSPSFPTPPPINPTYDQAPLGHRAAMTRIRDDIPEEDMPPRRRFVLTTPPPGCDIAEFQPSSVHATQLPQLAELPELIMLKSQHNGFEILDDSSGILRFVRERECVSSQENTNLVNSEVSVKILEFTVCGVPLLHRYMSHAPSSTLLKNVDEATHGMRSIIELTCNVSASFSRMCKSDGGLIRSSPMAQVMHLIDRIECTALSSILIAY